MRSYLCVLVCVCVARQCTLNELWMMKNMPNIHLLTYGATLQNWFRSTATATTETTATAHRASGHMADDALNNLYKHKANNADDI